MNFARSDECLSAYGVSFKDDKLIDTLSYYRKNKLEDFSKGAAFLPVNFFPEKEDTANGAEGIGL